MYRFRFVMQKGPTPGAALEISKPQMLIGRDPACDIVIADAEVSRRHARVLVSGDTCILEDLGSTNGTFVNGRRISAPYELKAGDSIMMGENVVVVFESQGFDPNATVMSRAPIHTGEQAPASAPPAGGFAGQVPASPETPPPPPAAAAAPPPPPVSSAPPKKKRSLTPWLFAGGGLLVLMCLCATFLIWVDMTYRWCQFFPFLAGCS